MKSSLSDVEIKSYLEKQMALFLPDGKSLTFLKDILKETLKRVEYNFSHSNLPLFFKNDEVYFNHLNSDQMTVFLATAANVAHFEGIDPTAAEKLFYLNKILHSFHCMYDTRLPKIFQVIHGVGTILGKADYSDYLVVCQGCTVGASNGKVPKIKDHVVMYPHSAILGDCEIGSFNVLSYGARVLNQTTGSQALIGAESSFNPVYKSQIERLSYYFKST